MKQRISGFTLSEVLIALAIIGVVAALTMPALINYSFEREMVSKLKKVYATMSTAALTWASDYGCENKISNCIAGGYLYNFFEDDYLTTERVSNADMVKYFPPLTDVYHLDGTLDNDGEGALHAVSSSAHAVTRSYMFPDGTLVTIYPCWSSSGMIFVDLNGKKKPNRMGKDQFNMSLGVRLYSPYNKAFIPYSDIYHGDRAGLCDVSSHNTSATACNPDDGKSPTAYVLKHDKLPDFAAMGYPTTP